MGSIKADSKDWAGRRSTPNLPRHVIEQIGQVLRNRYRENLLVPLPREMLTVLEAIGQSNSRMSSDRNE